jgi:hypothetical protein
MFGRRTLREFFFYLLGDELMINASFLQILPNRWDGFVPHLCGIFHSEEQLGSIPSTQPNTRMGARCGTVPFHST